MRIIHIFAHICANMRQSEFGAWPSSLIWADHTKGWSVISTTTMTTRESGSATTTARVDLSGSEATTARAPIPDFGMYFHKRRKVVSGAQHSSLPQLNIGSHSHNVTTTEPKIHKPHCCSTHDTNQVPIGFFLIIGTSTPGGMKAYIPSFHIDSIL